MPRKPTDKYWVSQVYAMVANNPSATANSIAQRLETVALENKRQDWPSPRTVSRLMENFRQLPPEERASYSKVRWPETMQAGLLPWEASQSTLELVKHHHRWGVRPLVIHARWFHYVSLAAPDAPFWMRFWSMAELAALELRPPDAGSGERDMRTLEWFLACTPWRSGCMAPYLRVVRESCLPGGLDAEKPVQPSPLLALLPGIASFAGVDMADIYDRFLSSDDEESKAARQQLDELEATLPDEQREDLQVLRRAMGFLLNMFAAVWESKIARGRPGTGGQR